MTARPKEGYHGPGWYRYRVIAHTTDGELLPVTELSKLFSRDEVLREFKRLKAFYEAAKTVKKFTIRYYYEGEEYPGGWT